MPGINNQPGKMTRQERLAEWKANNENARINNDKSNGGAKRVAMKKKKKVLSGSSGRLPISKKTTFSAVPDLRSPPAVDSPAKKMRRGSSEEFSYLSQSAKKLNSIKSRLLNSAKKRSARARTAAAAIVPVPKPALTKSQRVVTTASKPKKRVKDFKSTAKKVKDKNLNALIESEAKVAMEYACMGRIEDARVYMKELKDQFKTAMEMASYWTTVAALEQTAGTFERTVTAFTLGIHHARAGHETNLVQAAANAFWAKQGIQLESEHDIDAFFAHKSSNNIIVKIEPPAVTDAAETEVETKVTKQLCFDDDEPAGEQSCENTETENAAEKPTIEVEEANDAMFADTDDLDEFLALEEDESNSEEGKDAEKQSSSPMTESIPTDAEIVIKVEPVEQTDPQPASNRLVCRGSSLLSLGGGAKRIPTPRKSVAFGNLVRSPSSAAKRVTKSPSLEARASETPRKLQFADVDAASGSVVLVQAVRASGRKAKALGTKMTATPVRRSARNIKQSGEDGEVESRMQVLESVDFAYAPNPALDVLKEEIAPDAQTKDEIERLQMRQVVCGPEEYDLKKRKAQPQDITKDASPEKKSKSDGAEPGAKGSFTLTIDGLTPIVVRRSARLTPKKTPAAVREEMERALAEA